MNLPTTHWSKYRIRLDAERKAHWLTPAYHDVAVAIANLVFGGNTDPTVAQIAKAAICSRRTVQRARIVLQERGLLAVEVRFEQVDGRPQQRASEINLLMPNTPVVEKPKKPRNPRGSRERQTGTPSKEESLRKLAHERLAAMLEAAKRGPDLLKRREEALKAGWLKDGWGLRPRT